MKRLICALLVVLLCLSLAACAQQAPPADPEQRDPEPPAIEAPADPIPEPEDPADAPNTPVTEPETPADAPPAPTRTPALLVDTIGMTLAELEDAFGARSTPVTSASGFWGVSFTGYDIYFGLGKIDADTIQKTDPIICVDSNDAAIPVAIGMQIGMGSDALELALGEPLDIAPDESGSHSNCPYDAGFRYRGADGAVRCAVILYFDEPNEEGIYPLKRCFLNASY